MLGRALIRRCREVEKAVSNGAPGFLQLHATAVSPMERNPAAGYTRLRPDTEGADRNRRTRPGGRGMKLRSLVLILAVVLQASHSFGQDLLRTGIDANRRGDCAVALKAFHASRNGGNASGQNTLGILYGRGLGVPADHAEAVRWFRKAAEQGHTVAQHNLGAAYFRGRGVPRDDAEAIRWFRKAAGKGHAASSHNLGFAYFTGRGVPADNAEAALWFRRAAVQGLARAVQSRIPVLSGIRRTAGRCPRLRLVERSGRTRIRARWRVKGFDIAAAIDRRESRGAALDRENSQRTSACPMTRFSGRPESARRIALSRGTQTRVKLFCAAL